MLCYADEHFAWFAPSKEVNGDDWDDAPYEHNADPPYDRCGCIKVAYDGWFELPRAHQTNSRYSVDDINAGAIAWLRGSGVPVHIPAWTRLGDFRRLVAEAHGTVYEAVETG
jgi:hypothetical protein